ncbi:hypothetical protein DUNSADRAFT_14649 [Dunaliella salina]|uniref:Uncharacterized protein n=1 Tax=Dunaliella salina TaxID=3046 RepID=A0ABQ7G733_DUNSA|nr:hypothetical protein DUNSADRAFT_14649 [Dunaliella salina]|eukprot:KAF5830405.1 hypothetical protein DUNSADRAFT_14649 [Dunaliella salina]
MLHYLPQVVESRCKPEELLMLAAAPVRSQQQSLDATVQGALTSLMEENSVLRSRVRELESLTRSSNSSSSNSSGALGRYVRPATQSRFWAKTRSLGREDPPAGPRSQPAHFAPYSAPVALRSSGKLMPWSKRHSELLSEVGTGPGSTGNNSEHSSEAFSELTLRPVQLKRSARNSVHTASTRSGSLSQSQSLCSNRSFSHRWSSSVRSSIRSRSSARSRATTSDSKQEDEEHHGPDMERMGHDEIAAVAAASFRARGSCALEGLDQGPTSMNERRNEGRRSLPEVPQHLQAGRSDEGQAEGITMGGEHHHRLSQGGNNDVPGPRSEMTPYGLQALHERVSSASGSNGNEGGTAGSTRSSKQHHSEIQQHSEIQAAGADTRGVQEIEEETACEGQGGQLPSAQQQGTPNEQRAVQNDQHVAKQPGSSPQAGQPQCCAIQ